MRKTPKYNICSPQIGKKIQLSTRILDPVFALNVMPADDIRKGEQKLGDLQARAGLTADDLAKKMQELSTLDLKLYKIEKDYSKLVRDLEDTEKKIAERQVELMEFSKKEFELKVQIDLSRSRLEVIVGFLNRAQEVNLKQFSSTKNTFENLIKDNYASILLLNRENEKLNDVERISENFIKLLADPTREIISFEYLKACLKKPEDLITFFFENNFLAITEAIDRQSGFRPGGLESSMPQSENTSAKLSDERAITRECPSTSIKLLAKSFFDQKQQLMRSDSKAKHELHALTKNSLLDQVSIVPPLNLKPYPTVQAKPKPMTETSMGNREPSKKKLETRNSRGNIFQSFVSNADKNARPHSSMFHLDDDSVIFERDHALNDSHLDQSYLVIIENVFTLLDSLFQRIKSHVKVVYEECINSMDDIDAEIELSFCERLKS